MWCRHCQQDVPADAAGADGQPRCVRCGRTLEHPRVDFAAAAAAELDLDTRPPSLDEAESPATASAASAVDVDEDVFADLPPMPDSLLDDPQLDEQLRQAERFKQQHHRVDSPQPTLPPPAAWSMPPTMPPAATPPPPAMPAAGGGGGLSAVAWSIFCLALAVTACGVSLIATSVIQQRPDLWNVGLPIALAGNAGLLGGIALQLVALGARQRRYAREYELLQQRIAAVEARAGGGAMPYQSASQQFYLHYGHGASPHVLLADLKGQLDLLAMRLQQPTLR